MLRAATEHDVVLGVRLARERGWQVAVRSGGHSWAQWSVRDDALVIDLGGLQGDQYDDATGIVSASPAVQGGAELAPYLDARGRFFPGGHCPTVGIGGFLLQGGQGWNCRGLGWAAEYVEAVDVVTADGELVRADADAEADLYWAARGAGPGFFGVVTRFHLRTLPAPGHVAQTVHAYSLDDFDEVMTWLHGTHRSVAGHRRDRRAHQDRPGARAGPGAAGHRRRAGRRRGRGRRGAGAVPHLPALDRALMVVDAVPTTLEEQRERQLADNPEGHRWAVDNAWLTGPASEVLPAMRRAYTTLPTAKASRSGSAWRRCGRCRTWRSRCSRRSTSRRTSCGRTRPRTGTTGLAGGAMADLEPVTVGQYLGDSDLTRRQVRFLSDEAWARLRRSGPCATPTACSSGYLGRGPTARPTATTGS